MQKSHPLNSDFTFWFQAPKSQGSGAWENTMLKIGTFNTVEHFWTIYQHLTKIDKLQIESGFQLFLSNIKPMWEDPANIGGGRFVLRVKKNYANFFWENLILQLIGNQNQQICGMVTNVKEHEVIISIWVKQLQQEDKEYLKKWIRSALDLPDKIDIDFRDHPKVNV